MSLRPSAFSLLCVAAFVAAPLVRADSKSELAAAQAKKKGQQESQQAHAKAQETQLAARQQQQEEEEKSRKKTQEQAQNQGALKPAGTLKTVSAASLPQR